MKNKIFNQKGKNHRYIYFIVVGLILGSFFGSIVGHVVGAETYNLVLIKDSSDYIKYGFKDLGVYYTNNELMSFDMPFIVSKGAFVLSDKDLSSSVVGSVKDKSVLTARSPSYSYKILAENTNYYVINYHMDIKASNKTFSIDLIPSIKGVSIPKYAWWNSSFLYYKVLNIANKILGYQMKIIVGNSTGGNVSCGGHIKQGNYFKDVRFVNSANTTEYYHWMENQTVNTQATFWVNNSNNASEILIYYGNSVCANSTYRNGTKTFLLFDDFNDGSINAVKWTNAGPVTETGGYLKLIGASSAPVPFLYSVNYVFTTNTKVRFKGELKDTGTNVADASFRNTADTENLGLADDGGTISSYTSISPNVNVITVAGAGEGADHIWDICRNGITNTKVYYDGTLKNTHTLYISDDDFRYQFSAYKITCYIYLDWTMVCKYVATEPYWSSFGGETTNSPPSLTLVFPVNNSVGIDFTPVCSVWCNDTDTTLLTVTWQTNNSGAYVTRQVNSSFTANSICRYHFTWAVVSSTKYWFRVYVYDGVTNVTKWYCFTTRVNYTLSANIDFVILFPVNNSRDICPCCIVFGVNVSNNVSENMTLTFSNNDTGDFEVLSNLQNGTYYFTYCGFNLFGETYDWWLTIDSVTNSTTSDYQHFYITSNIDCSNVDISNIYTKPESDELFLSAILNIEPNLLFLGIVLSLWIYFVSKYFDKKEVIFAEIQFGLSMPLTLSLAVFSFNYPLGFVLVMIIPIFAIWILVSGFFYNKRQKNKR